MIHLSTTMPLCLLNRTRSMFEGWNKIKHVLRIKFYFHESGTTMVEISTITTKHSIFKLGMNIYDS